MLKMRSFFNFRIAFSRSIRQTQCLRYRCLRRRPPCQRSYFRLAELSHNRKKQPALPIVKHSGSSLPAYDYSGKLQFHLPASLEFWSPDGQKLLTNESSSICYSDAQPVILYPGCGQIQHITAIENAHHSPYLGLYGTMSWRPNPVP